MIFKTNAGLADNNIDKNDLTLELIYKYFNFELAYICGSMLIGDKITHSGKGCNYYIERIR
jgi:hypothetical protein